MPLHIPVNSYALFDSLFTRLKCLLIVGFLDLWTDNLS